MVALPLCGCYAGPADVWSWWYPGELETRAGGAGSARRRAGTSTSDSIPIRVSRGEFVVNAAAVARHRMLLEAINAGRTPAGAGAFAPTVVVQSTTEQQVSTIMRHLQYMQITHARKR